MAKDEIKKLLEDSKKVLEETHDSSQKTIKDDLSSFKKKTLDRI